MREKPNRAQITVLDTGGQYCHLIARKIRDLGVYAEVAPSDRPAAELLGSKGLVISGGPASVYEPGSPTIDPAILQSGAAVLGICYGHQLMAKLLGGVVERGHKGEYGLAMFEPLSSPLFAGAGDTQQIWMSHSDTVRSVPAGFQVDGRTETCEIAAMSDRSRRLYGIQFHPEVVHTTHGRQILSNFVYGICGCEPDWDPRDRVAQIEAEIRQAAGERNVFFFVSGGVDSTVAYTLCLKALGESRVTGLYVDTGLMRQDETSFVERLFSHIGSQHFRIEDASARFLGALEGVRDPETKRHIIGEQFVELQEGILNSGDFLNGHWILGQGTIYPDTIESGGTAKADVIKTHHNRVSGIQRLIAENRIVEPLSSFYKDEVRTIGVELGLPSEFLNRHPFPGPGLAIRCLCAAAELPVRELNEGWLIPVSSVGVQGDARTYKPILAITGFNLHERATALTNGMKEINRVVTHVSGHVDLNSMSVRKSEIHPERLARLRSADALVRQLCEQSGFDKKVWQFPVILIPVGTVEMPDSIVLRPIESVDGMTARSVEMEKDLLERLTRELLHIDGVCGVFYDLTHKPPGTIEWE